MSDEALRAFLDRVEGHLGGSAKGDILREIESHVWDRAEALSAARGAEEPGPEDLRRAMEELGDPSQLAVSYSGERHLVPPRQYAAFWYFTGLVFAIHLAMLLIAATTRTYFDFFPFNVLPAGKLTGGAAVVTVVSLAVQAFLFDAGLVLILFFLLGRTIRRVDLPNLTFRVESSRRPSLVRAGFALVVLLMLGVPDIRDTLFTVHAAGDGDRIDVHNLFLPSFGRVLPFVAGFLLLAIVKDVLYAVLRERVLTVALDMLTAAAGVGLSLYLFTEPEFLGLPSDFPLNAEQLAFINEVLSRVLSLFFIVWAALFAARAVKRAMRLQQIWGEKEPGRL